MRNGNSDSSFQSWGRYPRHRANLIPLHWTSDFPLPSSPGTSMLPVGLGRSYGDVCLLEGGTLLGSTGLSRLIAFDPQRGLLRCEAGVSLADILDFAVPRGWFLPTTPGTKYRHRGRCHCQRRPWKESSRRRHLRMSCAAPRIGSLRRLALRVFWKREFRMVSGHDRWSRPHRTHHLGRCPIAPDCFAQNRLRGNQVCRHRRVSSHLARVRSN